MPKKKTKDEAEQAATEPELPREKNAAAVELGRLGGLKGGPARALALSAGRRHAIAKKAAAARRDVSATSRLGGLKGGAARAKKLTANQRAAIARKGGLAAAARRRQPEK